MWKGGFALVFVLCIVPFALNAQTTAELQAKIDALLAQIRTLQERLATSVPTASPPASVSCPVLARALAVGSRGDDVMQLQIFLKAKGYMSDEATGYFGVLTEAALKKLQAAHGVVSSGNAATTGYGSLGPKTRAVIATLCASAPEAAVTTSTPTQQCAQVTSPTAPNAGCAGQWEKLMNGACHIGWRCVLSAHGGNRPPVVSGITGPNALLVDSFGAWKVEALDPEGGPLSYSVTWGDENAADILSAIAGLSGTYVSSSNFTHSFGKAGTYTVQFSVRDSAGNVTSSNVSVRVGASGGSGGTVGTYTNPVAPTGTGVGASCLTPWGNQIVVASSTIAWQPFFTEGAYYTATSPLMRCSNGAWQKCNAAGTNCQSYVHPTSTPDTAALPSYTTSIGGKCSPEGSTRKVSVPPGTQLCQWLNCRITTTVETVTLKCTHSGWTDYADY